MSTMLNYIAKFVYVYAPDKYNGYYVKDIDTS